MTLDIILIDFLDENLAAAVSPFSIACYILLEEVYELSPQISEYKVV